MKKPSFVDFLEKALLAVLCLASLALIVSGVFFGATWSAFGLILLAPSAIATVCYVYRPTGGDQEFAKMPRKPSKAA